MQQGLEKGGASRPGARQEPRRLGQQAASGERGGKPIRVRLSVGQRHESVEALPLLEETLERMWPDAVAGDKGYSTAAIRNWLAQREIEAVIPKREEEEGAEK